MAGTANQETLYFPQTELAEFPQIAEIDDLLSGMESNGSIDSLLLPMPERFSESVSYMRPPERETYGRSLGTIHRLGAFMIDKSFSEIIMSPESAQAKAEFYTSVEEGFGTDIELGAGLEVRDFDVRPVINGRVMAKDLKTSISSMTEAGLICAEEKYAVESARNDERFLPQLIRSKWDHENALTVDQMARGETSYNTRIVISPFPQEGAAQSGDEYWRDIGYVPHLRRGFVQLYHATEGAIVTGSLSFDGSDKGKLREIFNQFGIEIPEGEITDNWLKYAFTGTLSEEEAKRFALEIADTAGDSKYKKNTNTVDVTKQYKPLIERVFNESYVHICESLFRGKQTNGARELIYQFADKAHHFNEHYARALHRMRANKDQFTDDDSVVLHELLVYSTIEMMRALHLKKSESHHDLVHLNYHDVYTMPAYLQAADPRLFKNMLGGFGADGARNNRTYSACGLSISLGENNTRESPQSPFGGQDNSRGKDEDRLGSRWFTCPKGHLNYRRVANVKEKVCRVCKIDISCKGPRKPKKSITQNIGHTLFGESKNTENNKNISSKKNTYALAA